MRLMAIVMCAGVGSLAATSLGQPIYSNVDSPVIDRFTGNATIFGQNAQVNLNAVATDGGGILESITFSAGVPEFGPIGGAPLLSDATVFLYTDDGDLNPDDDGDAVADADQLLFQSALVSLPGVREGDHILHTIDVSGSGVSVAPNSTLWVGVQFTDASFGQVIYSPPAVGSTDGAIWHPARGLFNISPNSGFGFELTVPAPGPAGAALGGLIGVAWLRRRR